MIKKDFKLDPNDADKIATNKTFSLVCFIYAGVPFKNGKLVDLNSQPNSKELWHNWREVKRVLTESRINADGSVTRMTMGECDAIIKGKKKLPAKLQKKMVPYGAKRPTTKRPPTKEDRKAVLKGMSKKELTDLLKELGNE